jgi:signal transduction histidine kinase
MAGLKTHFAPAERASPGEAAAQNRRLASEPILGQVLVAVSDAVAVLNRQRQVVYANRGLLELLQAATTDKVTGYRPGELLHCINASQMEHGCGTAEACRFCGAVQAIVDTQATGRPHTRECTIVSRGAEREVSYNLQVTATPFYLDGEDYVFLSLKDISQDKRRVILERIFFHDILNTTSSLKIYASLLRSASPEGSARFLADMDSIIEALVEEIQSQKMLVNAENGTLQVRQDLIDSGQLAEELIRVFQPDELARGKTLEIAPSSQAFVLISDSAILRRVLANMLKNALEASLEGATVTLGFVKDEGACSFWVHNPGHIEPEVQRQIFRRFFSTKGQNRGLGTYSIKLLGEDYLKGRVDFSSDPEAGTRFILALPLGAIEKKP